MPSTITLTDTAVEIHFTGLERLFTGHTDVRIPLTAITTATTVPDTLHAARGTRRGLAITGLAKIGTWGLVRGPRTLVAAHRATPGLLLGLKPGTFRRYEAVLVSHENAAGLVERIERALEPA